jgi:signal transduction histidine kinase
LTRQRLADEELREFAVREAQLQSAGRLAAEFAHQLKNPLAIINNAAYSLKKSLAENKGAVEQVRIIEEEVEHSDRIITQVMGYAQLSEGRVEKLDLIEELDRAIAQVFPPAVDSKIEVHRDYDHKFPPLLMQRRHLAESLVNLLQNSREAFDGACGNVSVSARCLSDYSTQITVMDDGPGVAAEKRERVFEPYYTTKKKGTGLGLATVRHNVELYGGSVRLESELGKGAQFTIIFPARTLMRLDKKPQL